MMAGRLQQAKKAAYLRYQDFAMSPSVNNVDHVEVSLIRGISHGFLQMLMILPEARNASARCRGWLEALLGDEDQIVVQKANAFNNITAHNNDELDKPLLIDTSRTKNPENYNPSDIESTDFSTQWRNRQYEIWEKDNLIPVEILMQRRQQGLLRGHTLKEPALSPGV